MKRLIYIFLSLIVLNACNRSNKIKLTGAIENGEGKSVTFSELLVNGTKEIKTIKLKKDGKFKFASSSDIPRFYNLSVSKNNFITLLIEPGEDVKIHADISNLSNSVIEGSKGSVFVQKLNNQLVETKRKLDSLVNIAKSIEGTDDYDKRIGEINNMYAKIVDRQRDSSIAFIVSNLNSLACIVALYQKYDDENYVLYKNRDLQYIKIVSESLVKKYPQSQHVKALIADKENLFKRYNQLKTNKKLSELAGKEEVYSLPEVYLPDQAGDSISLNSIDTKYILLSFWASWNKDCIKRNIELLDVYKKYHTKGFEIYQVSLDTKKENWIQAINFDQLPWINVIDMNGRTSYFAKIYNVRTLPTSYLINPDRDIVILNPTKQELINTFEYALK